MKDMDWDIWGFIFEARLVFCIFGQQVKTSDGEAEVSIMGQLSYARTHELQLIS